MSAKSLALIAFTALALPSLAATRLTYVMHGKNVQVIWPTSAFPLRYDVETKLAEVLPGGASAVDRAFALWALPDTVMSFQASGPSVSTIAGYDKTNGITLSDSLMRDNGFLAMTTNWYDDNGNLTEGDIQIDRAVATGGYNVEQTIAHEIGHLLGLDHSAVLSAVMYPFIGHGNTPIALDSDDRVAIASMYSRNDPALSGATLRGRVSGDNGGIFAAQVVAVSDRGEAVATGLTDNSGEFLLTGLPAGKYRLYAEPLDGPVDSQNLAGVWRQAKLISFPTSFFDGPAMQVENGRVYGNLAVSSAGTSALNPRWIGTSSGDRGDFSLSTTPISVSAGQRITIAIAGDGFTSGMTTYEILNPALRRVSDFRYASNYVYATWDVAPNADTSSAIVLVRSGNEMATLTGALKIASVSSPPRRRLSK
ncbi:MAG TPA: matrixin family metalloprotease [Thermoanaerobaculia bacterium]|nr:matrixin family metalloprotease [Thermoanaerobaculia bacterium]